VTRTTPANTVTHANLNSVDVLHAGCDRTRGVCRAARVRSADLADGSQNAMFRPLFSHIQNNNISMTTPVEMGYDDAAPQQIRPVSMAFLYGDPGAGQTGTQGNIQVVDLPAMTVVSIGIRGSYSEEHYREGLAELRSWLDVNKDRYTPTGPARFLGYNSPFVPWFMRFGEMQISVTVK
jgi:hypothetical protein